MRGKPPMKKLFLGLSLSFLASTAFAADAVVEEVRVAESAYSWSGLYVGGQVGYVFEGRADYIYINPAYNYRHDLDGFIGGVYVGYNYQFTNGIVLGAEADLAWGDVGGSDVAPGDDIFSSTTEIDWTGSVRMRLGYAIDRFLPYVTGGVAFGRFGFEEFAAGAPYGSADDNLVGWTLGAGGEYALTDNWLLRGEYRYTEFDKKDFVSQPVDEDLSVDIHTHDFRIGAAYKF
ncbi:porin family protein [Mesorhizobium sp. M6A.T.Ce.TU.002.03.1.1]|nr:porin family protein [Mesorhizobium sp. M6A.T.Ce.TU.002.03.1.1]